MGSGLAKVAGMIRLLALTICIFISACSFPDTPLWQERDVAGGVRMPMEVAFKAVVKGSVESLASNPVTSTRKGLGMWKGRAGLLVDPLVGAQLALHDSYVGGGDVERALDIIGMPMAYPGKVSYCIDGRNFFGELEKEIRGAKMRVDTRVFIFDNDDVAAAYADLLRHRSHEVKCRVLMDTLGSVASWWGTPESMMRSGFKPVSSMPHYLRSASKVKVRESRNPWLVTDHSKLFIIDGRVAFLGGMNIGREYRYEWHDMMVRLEGTVVGELQNEFTKSWVLQGFWGDWAAAFHRVSKVRAHPIDGEIPVRILKTGMGKTDIERALLAAVRSSRKRVYLQNSYFTSELLLRELVAARKRGVDVRMVFPSNNDSALLDVANTRVAAVLLDNGAIVYRYPIFSHVKAVVVDDWSCLGSANFDGLSMRINDELNIGFTDKSMTQKLVRDLFQKDFAASRRVKRSDLKLSKVPMSQTLLQQL